LLGRQWYNRIDENVVLGALPLDRTMIETLQRRENVAAVINVCRKHEWVVPDHDPESLYSELGIAYLSLPTVDFQVPTVEAVTSGIQVTRCIKSNPSSGVYIHCKAGKGRSATLGLCYLIWRYGLAPREAQARLLASRPQV
ncbi:protein-tyrosine phosphatase-like protein, partial [Polychytrium aggregatum]|uniref:protein-tyrosine phosphatase-like protein n=1 Tax=Polychytrium aggregatum TaxID=110093 RepID=UPI0022FE2C46